MTFYILITILSFTASCFGMISGFGISTFMIPIMLNFMPFTPTILLVGIVHWFHNIWKIAFFRKKINWHLFMLFGIPGIATSFIGALLLNEQGDILAPLLGLFLIGYVVMLMVAPDFRLKYDPVNAFIGGSLSGFFAGLFGIRGPIRSVFLSAFDIDSRTYIATTGVISFVIDTVRLSGYWIKGISLESQLAWGLLLFVPASFLGAQLGKRLLHTIPQHHFRKVLAIFLLIMGLRLMVGPLIAQIKGDPMPKVGRPLVLPE